MTTFGVLHIPHSSTIVPADVRGDLLLTDQALQAEILAMTDHFTDRLFACESVQRVVFPVSRLVVDPERFTDDAKEPMTSRGMGVIYTNGSAGQLLRHPPTAAARSELLARFYSPHHAALERAVGADLSTWGASLVIDCHSFPSKALPYELDQSPDRPDICLGTDTFHTPPRLVEMAREAFERAGWRVAVDRPFSGTMVPAKHYRQTPELASLMIEVNRGLYIDEATGRALDNFDAVASLVSHAVRGLLLHDRGA